MTTALFETIITGVSIVVAALVLVQTVRMIKRRPRVMSIIFFAFAAVGFLLSEFYWLAYDVLREGEHMPFAANEFSETAVSLMLASVLRSVFRGRFLELRRHALLSGLYALCCIGLWICWNGDWIEALLTGPAFLYYIVVCVCSLKQSGALSSRGFAVLAASAFSIIVLNALAVAFPVIGPTVELIGYVWMFLTAGGFVWWIVRAVRRKAGAEVLLSLTFCASAWCINAMYMCDGWWYLGMELLYVASLPMMMLAVKREADA